MYSRIQMKESTENFSAAIEKLKQAMDSANAIVIGAGAGLSASAGFSYSGDRFLEYFADFHEKYGISDMYSGGFYPYESLEEYWAWWSRHIFVNRYMDTPKDTYKILLDLVKDKDYFVLTTNVDHQFQKAGFDKNRLFYTQGDYGLWQCSLPCHDETYDNEEAVKRMYQTQKDMKIPSELIPKCPKCGRPMTMNLRCGHTFVEDAGWHTAANRYEDFLEKHQRGKVLFFELGVGANTSGIIKYPFWKFTFKNPKAVYACLNQGETFCPQDIADQSICIDSDITESLLKLQQH